MLLSPEAILASVLSLDFFLYIEEEVNDQLWDLVYDEANPSVNLHRTYKERSAVKQSVRMFWRMR